MNNQHFQTTNKRQSSSGKRRAIGASILILFTVCLVWQPAQIKAQAWTESGSNIFSANTGNVGIGTSSPTSKVHIVGSGSINDPLLQAGSPGATDSNSFMFYNGSSSISTFISGGFGHFMPGTTPGDGGFRVGTAFSLFFGDSFNSRMVIRSSGNVGIGTTAPAQNLEVVDTDNNGYAMSLYRPQNGLNYGVGEEFALNNSVGSRTTYGHIAGVIEDSTANAERGSLYFLTKNAGSLLVNMVLTGAGNVGIGTRTPNSSSKLHVAGNIQVDGNINAKYQDIAEWVESSQTLSSGTVVILDANRNNQVIASNSAYDTTVAGVVSERPGVLLGEGGAGKAKIATTGRVKVRVDATKSPIKIGDLLVTSDVAGTAMKSIPIDMSGVKIHRPGTIVGKALEPLAGGTGEILVLLSLQ